MRPVPSSTQLMPHSGHGVGQRFLAHHLHNKSSLGGERHPLPKLQSSLEEGSPSQVIQPWVMTEQSVA